MALFDQMQHKEPLMLQDVVHCDAVGSSADSASFVFHEHGKCVAVMRPCHLFYVKLTLLSSEILLCLTLTRGHKDTSRVLLCFFFTTPTHISSKGQTWQPSRHADLALELADYITSVSFRHLTAPAISGCIHMHQNPLVFQGNV